MTDQIIGTNLIVLDTVDSTNNYVANHPHIHDLTEGTAILALAQNEGRGQHGNTWLSGEGDLTVSYLLRPQNLNQASTFSLNKAISIGVQACLSDILPDEEVSIKWPNDLIVRHKKIAGLLIEFSWIGQRCQHAVVGLGVNLRSKGEDLDSKAISLSELIDTELNLLAIQQLFATSLDKAYARFRQNDGEAINADYKQLLYGRETDYPFIINGEQGICQLQDVDEQGRAVLSYEGEMRSLVHGEARQPL